MWLLMLVMTGGSMFNVVADVGANWRWYVLMLVLTGGSMF